jgi:hypothetical protein
MTAGCPFACPICRGPLGWGGECLNCHGCRTGRRADWTFPGDTYELQGGHYRLVARGRTPVCSPEDNAAAMRTLRTILRRTAHEPAIVVALGMGDQTHEEETG